MVTFEGRAIWAETGRDRPFLFYSPLHCFHSSYEDNFMALFMQLF